MNFMAKITGFLVTMRDWKKAGCPRRAPEWVAELFEKHCNLCEQYDPDSGNILTATLGGQGICQECGCHVSADPENYANALTYPNKGCPLGYFTASVEDSHE